MWVSILVALMLGGCATLLTDDHAVIKVNRTRFYVDNKLVEGSWTQVNQRTRHKISDEDGCVVKMNTRTSGFFFANILLGGVVFLVLRKEKPSAPYIGFGIALGGMLDWLLDKHKVADKTRFNLDIAACE